MKAWPVALQLYSVRTDAQQDFPGTLRNVREMGYDGVELAGTYGRKPLEAKALLDEAGLALVSAHVPMNELEQDAVLDAYATIGLRFITIPWQVGPKTQQELDTAIERMYRIAVRCKERGMMLLYHNHDFEFRRIGGSYILDSYFSRIPQELLQTELDVCWVKVGGEAPEAYLRKYAGRAPVVHLKDFSGEKSEHMYGLIGKDAEMAEKPNTFAFRPVGYGRQDIPSILEAAEEARSEWIVVEQDEPGMGLDAMTCARMSVKYLQSLLRVFA